MRRRGSRMEGKKLPFRSLGMASSTSPALVETSRGRCPLRSLVRLAALIALGADRGGSLGLDQLLEDRRRPRGPGRDRRRWNASSSSDRADWSRAIGVLSLVGSARNTPRITPLAPLLVDPPGHLKAHHSEGRTLATRRLTVTLPMDGDSPEQIMWVLVCSDTGLIYRHQYGGFYCRHAEVEVFLVPAMGASRGKRGTRRPVLGGARHERCARRSASRSRPQGVRSSSEGVVQRHGSAHGAATD